MHGADHLVEFRLEAGLPVWRYEVDGFVAREAAAHAHRQNTVYVSYRLLEGDGPLRLKLRPSRPLPRRTTTAVSRPPGRRRTRLTVATTASSCPAGPTCRRCGCALDGGERPRSPSTGKQIARRALPRRGEPRLRVAGRAVESPGYFRADLGRRRGGHARSPRPSRGSASSAAAARARRSAAELRAPASGCSTAGRPRRPRRARRPSWCWPPTSSSSRPPAASRTPPAPAPPATRSARSSPATTGSPTGAATP